MKNKFFSIFAPFVLSITCAYGVDTFFFIAGDGGINNANDRSQWVNLSTYNSSGDTFLFQLFPVGTDERVSLDKGNYRAGAINAVQSSVITAESNVIFNRYCLGDLQPDGSVTFNDANIKNPDPIVFNGDFTVNNIFARINHYVDFQFADAESITLTAKEINLNSITNAHFTKTTAGEVNIHVDGRFLWVGGNNLYLGSSKGFIDSFYADAIDVMGNPKTLLFDFYVNKIDCASTSFVSDNGTISATVNLHINKLSANAPIFYFGTTTKLKDNVINIDFSSADVEGLSAGEYKILSVDSQWSEGFADGGSLTDFNINDDLLNAMDIEHNFTWDGESLVLNVVPEPADVAAFLGFAVLAFAFIRRRK